MEDQYTETTEYDEGLTQEEWEAGRTPGFVLAEDDSRFTRLSASDPSWPANQPEKEREMAALKQGTRVDAIQFIKTEPYENQGLVEKVGHTMFHDEAFIEGEMFVDESDVRGWGVFNAIVRIEDGQSCSQYALALIEGTEA